MNSSANRIVVAVLVLVVGGMALYFTGDKVLWQPYKKLKNRLALIESDYEDKERAFRDFKLAQANFAKYNKMSLPSDFDGAVSKYRKTLKPILEEAGLVVGTFNDPLPPPVVANAAGQKKPRHTILQFDVRAKGPADAVLTALEALRKLSLMHRIKAVELERAESVTLEKDPTGQLNVHLVIEAMIIYGVNNPFKFEDIQREKQINSDRDYAMIKDRNPFLGAQFVNVTRTKTETSFVGPDVPLFVVLDTISTSNVADNGEKEAFLSNRIYQSGFIRLRTAPGFDTFRIFADKDRNWPMHRCKVLKIDDREIYYQLGEDVYKMTIYQTLAESMKRSLDANQLDALGLTSKVDAEFSKIVEADAKKPGVAAPRTGASSKVGADSSKGPMAAKGPRQGTGPQNPKGQPKGQPNSKQKKDRAG